jgi:DNA primase
MKPTGSGMSDVERVRDAADIVRIVGDHVTLKAKGREYVGLCPFHDDHNPSMAVVPGKQIFKCFVCGAGGDVFSFIQLYHRMEFREALEYLAERCNITLTPRGAMPEEGGEPGFNRSSLAEANAQAAAFFRAVLNHPEHGRAARAVIERRGISAEMVERFSLGAAPDRWDGLAMKIDSQRWDRGLFGAAGLLKRRDDGGFYDSFRNRLMFPIRDQIGRVIAFGARRIDDEDEPKYLNSPESPLFNKSASIFGLHQAVQAIQRERTAIITEGYTDVIACHQAGVEHAVATLGTALTPGHATILRRLCDTVVLLFDGDEAGHKAADRAVEVFFGESLDVRIATLDKFTDAKDPDELLKREGGREVLLRAVGEGVGLLDYRFGRLRERLAGAGPSALERATNEEIAKLAQLGFHRATPIRRQLLLKRLAAITGLEESLLAEQMRRAKGAAGRGAEAPGAEPARAGEAGAAGEAADPVHLVEALGCVLTEGSLWAGLSVEDRRLLAPEAYGSRVLFQIATAVRQVASEGRAPGLRAVLDAIEDTGVKSRAVDIQTNTERVAEERVGAYLADCLTRERRRLSERDGREGRGGAGADGAGFAAMIELKRRQIEEFGPDRRRIARPTGRGPAARNPGPECQ